MEKSPNVGQLLEVTPISTTLQDCSNCTIGVSAFDEINACLKKRQYSGESITSYGVAAAELGEFTGKLRPHFWG